MKRWQLPFVLGLTLLLTSCDFIERVERKSAKINRYQNVAMTLAKQNRELELEIDRLKYEIQVLKSKKHYLQINLEKAKNAGVKKSSRTIASIPKMSASDDKVKFGVYKWTPSQMMAVAEKEFSKKNYEKSAQFFKSFLTHFPTHKNVDDRFLFQAGMAAFESGKHYDWTLDHFNKLVAEYPTSQYYRGAKLWMGLTYLKLGDNDKFFETVEEFRKKYRNTSEWKILSSHYEKIVQKYKSN